MKRVTLLVLVCFLMFGITVYASDEPSINNPSDGEVISVSDTQITWSGENAYYLSVEDNDTNGRIINQLEVSENSYILKKEQLESGHSYTVTLTSIEDESINTSSNFTTEEDFDVAFVSPEIMTPENGETLNLDDISIGWFESENSDYYLITIKDLTSNDTIISNQDLKNDGYIIANELLTPSHEYEVNVAAVKGNEEKWSKIHFEIRAEEIDLEIPEIYQRGDETMKLSDYMIHWKTVERADYYLISVKDTTDNKYVVKNQKETGEYYNIKEEVLTAGHDYTFYVEAVKGESTSKDDADFSIMDESEKVTGMVINYPDYNDGVPYKELSISWSGGMYAEHYLLTLKDLTTGEYVFERKEVASMFGYKRISASDLEIGHDYKIFLAAVAEGQEKWTESIFYVEYPTIEYPRFEEPRKETTIPYADYKIEWKASDYLDKYEIVITDTTLDEVLIDEDVKKAYFKLEQSDLKPEHSYHVKVTAIRGDKSRSKEIDFQVESVDTESPVLNLKSNYNITDIVLEWDDVLGVEKYYIVLQDLDTKEMLINKEETTESTYTINSDLLTDSHNYKLAVAAVDKLSENYVYHNFSVGHIIADENVKNKVSTWAQSFVDAVKEKGLLEESMYNSLLENPQATLTRVEFCEMLVSLYDSFESPVIQVDLSKAKSFTDIAHLTSIQQEAIGKANSLGIISGTSDTTFNPDGSVTRQEMAVMLKNLHFAVLGDMSSSDWKDNFEDKGSIASWAVSSVKFVNSMDILNGDGKRFNPMDLATHEMGFVLLEKSHERFSK